MRFFSIVQSLKRIRHDRAPWAVGRGPNGGLHDCKWGESKANGAISPKCRGEMLKNRLYDEGYVKLLHRKYGDDY